MGDYLVMKKKWETHSNEGGVGAIGRKANSETLCGQGVMKWACVFADCGLGFDLNSAVEELCVPRQVTFWLFFNVCIVQHFNTMLDEENLQGLEMTQKSHSISLLLKPL